MSTAHIYGDPPAATCTEEAAFGYGLVPFVGKAWEATFQQYLPEAMRRITLRTSFVIGKKGGVFTILQRLVRWGLGGWAEYGQQGMSWIYEKDLNRLITKSIEDLKYGGVYIASAPEPVSNVSFMKQLPKNMRILRGLPSRPWMIKIDAHSRRLPEVGFEFLFPWLSAAIDDLLK